jgi:ABC-type multidrug transport system fused ATPase/permease subunit
VEGAVVNEVTPGSVIGRAWEIYKSQFGLLIIAAVLLSLITLVAALLLGPFVGIVSLVVSLFYTGGVVRLVQDLEDGRRDEEASKLFTGVSSVFWPLLAVAILAGIGIAIGFVLLIIPGLILLTIWSVVVPVVVLEKPGVFAAFGRSRELVRGHGWQVFAIILLVFLISIVLGLVAGIIVAAAGGGDAVVAIVNWLVNALTLPLVALVTAVLYFRLKAVKNEVPATTPEPADWGQQPAT